MKLIFRTKLVQTPRQRPWGVTAVRAQHCPGAVDVKHAKMIRTPIPTRNLPPSRSPTPSALFEGWFGAYALVEVFYFFLFFNPIFSIIYCTFFGFCFIFTLQLQSHNAHTHTINPVTPRPFPLVSNHLIFIITFISSLRSKLYPIE